MSGSNQSSEEHQDGGWSAGWEGALLERASLVRLQLNRDLNEGASHVDIWGKSLPDRGVDKVQWPWEECETRPVWPGRVVREESRGSWRPDHRGPGIEYFPLVPLDPLSPLLYSLGSWRLWTTSTCSLDLWLPMRLGQWESPTRNQRAGVLFTEGHNFYQVTPASSEFPMLFRGGVGMPNASHGC